MNAFHRLSPREKILILLVLPLALLFAFHRFGWVPLNDARHTARAEIATYRALIEATKNRFSQPVVIATPKPAATPLATRITRSADVAGVLVRRLEPEGAIVRVSLADAQYDVVLAWIAEMEAEDGVALVALEMDRRTTPGMVATRLTVKDAE